MMNIPKFNDGSVHFRNTGMKELTHREDPVQNEQLNRLSLAPAVQGSFDMLLI